ncbi:unnamed protein product [Caenorhabditis auriculariae]|uniref:SSD domain-containing protein n=1 Tax=Caenorhabditis auriculariae TaxID=2777116 RepID=A0A8S1HVT3_9PELO|nr:unnamed protein product [Caenorhabditis auriculariae]
MWDQLSSYVARLLASYPYHSISASVLFCVLMTGGLVHIKLEQDIRASFSPVGSETEYETEVYLDFFNLTVYPERAFLIFTARGDSNVLAPQNLKHVLGHDAEIQAAISTLDPSNRRNCEPLCDLNKPFHYLISQLQRKNLTNDDVFLGLHLSDVLIDFKNLSHPMSAKTIILWYFSRSDSPAAKSAFGKKINELFELSMNEELYEEIEFTVFSDQIANREMIRGAIEATTLMTIGFFLLLTLTIIVIWRQTSIRQAPVLVAVSLLTPIAATVSSFGALCWLGLPSFSIQCVTPFLVLGIGVDDAFILIHRWRHHSSIVDRTSRLDQVIVDVGPSITITSLTNIIAFGIGFFTPTPQMSLFCLAASLALLFDYIFTYTILAPFVFLSNDENYVPVSSKSEKLSPHSFLAKYSRFLCSLNGRLICGLVLISFYAFTTYGVFTMKATFEPAKAFPSNSRLVNALNAIKPVFNVYFPINVFVKSPPNISNSEEYKDFYRMIDDLEQVPGILGDNRTLLFLPHYEAFDRKISSVMSFFGGESTVSYDNLQFWLHQIGNPPIVNFKNENGTAQLESFRFTLLGRGMSEWAERAQAMQDVRGILRKNADKFNVTLFDGDSAILLMILSVGTDLIGSIAVTVACMAVICLVFITNRTAVLVITSMIVSICFTLVGCLSWWGADLDPVTQVDVLLATGFSVDYTAHVAYQYFRAKGSPLDRVHISLAEMAEPMLEAGFSTFLCMLPLIFVPTYAIVAFAKTIFLVVGIGLLHGLFILPVVLALFSSDRQEEVRLPTVEKDLIAPPLLTEPLVERALG